MQIFKKEKAVRHLALEHAQLVQRCLTASSDALQAYLDGPNLPFDEHVRRVSKLESKADTLKREACDLLQSGAFLPHIRSDVYRLVKVVDHVAGCAEDTARFLADQSPDIPEAFREALAEILTLNLHSYDALFAALSSFFKPKGEITEVDTQVNRVSQLESEVDRSQAMLTQQIFSSDLDLSARMHLTQLVNSVCAISDAAKSGSEELRFAALKSVV